MRICTDYHYTMIRSNGLKLQIEKVTGLFNYEIKYHDAVS